MGAVGLSFGSPTSGAGFDVSSTVASIVSNLQNVETPWKTQLTAMEAQDTTISSLGTLFSNLSNDLSSLTDSSGVLAVKTGSSSDENVLQLTSASNSATAGTHVVEVSNLAQTSSGYLAEVTSASTTLSGSITLGVGGGTTQTINIADLSTKTLTGLAGAINSSGVGITASVLTDSSGSRLSLVSGTSGAGGNIAVSSNTISAAATNTLGYTGTAGTANANSTGTLAAVASPSETLSGSISIQVGSQTAASVTMATVSAAEGSATLSSLESYINNNPSTFGAHASIINNSDGTSSLSLTSQTAGSAGSLTVNSGLTDSQTSLSYTSTVTGKDASLTVDGVNLTSSSNTVSNLIPGVTFQLLAPSAAESDGSLEQVQVVIGNNNTGVESTVNQFVSDYNSLMSAVNAQEGNDSSGNPEPLFGSPTLSLLQQQLLTALNVQNPSGYMDAVSSSVPATLSGSITVQAGNGTSETVTVGPSSNTLSGLAAAINAANGSAAMSYSGTAGSNGVTSSGTLSATGTGSGTALSGTMTIQVGNGTTENIVIGAEPSGGAADNTIYTGSGSATVSELASAINTANLGVTADAVTTNGTTSLALTSGTTGSDGTLTVTSNLVVAGSGVTANVVTNDGTSNLMLSSIASGASGALIVTSALTASSPSQLSYTDSGYTNTTPDSGSLGNVKSGSDVLSGSLTIQVGSQPAGSVSLDSSDNTLSGLMSAINQGNLGVTAGLNSAGTALILTSSVNGSAGALAITSNILDASNPVSTKLNYNNSSDLNSLTSMGISVNDDGTITFDASSLDSLLNTDFSSVAGFFQNANSWGQAFSNILTNAGTSSSTGILALASASNSTMESTLKADISNEETLISAQQISLTAELNSANEIMQELPTQLQGVNELYSAITGYNQNSNG
jgi:flagellar hook-associated protein 2